MSKRLLLIAITALLLPMSAILPTSLQSAGLPTLKAKGAEAIDRLFKAAVAQKELAGVVAAVVNKNQTLYLKAFGNQDVAQNVPLSKDTVFRIASMTKPVTSVAVMMLVEQGKLRLDDAVGNYLPALKGREVIATFNEKDATYTTRPAKQEMTIRHLLAHTSGLSYSFTSPTILSLQQKTGKNQRDLPLLFDPGTKWQYSHSTAALGDIVEKLSGQSLEDYFQANIFRPLQMTDTSFLLPAEKARRLVTVHQREATGLVETPNPAKYTSVVRGDGGLVSTASDYSAFLHMLLNEGSWHGARLLKPATVRLMTSNQIGALVVEEMPVVIPKQSAAFPFGAGKDKFGLGFQITMTEGKAAHERSAGSYTWAGIFNTHFWVDPKRGIGVVFLTQELPFYNTTTMVVMRRFEHLIYEHLQ
ncbi:MAG: beta-lactamase family protein [Acidobacteria bacterium]|nr:beta-lactamase family protein [Acidobacteriota bacterium]MBI3422243.1 beta-lactamase family protein [Acidobacteriota bacterium]